MVKKYVTQEKFVAPPEKKEPVATAVKPEKEKKIDPKQEVINNIRNILKDFLEGAEELRLQRPHVKQVREMMLKNVDKLKQILKMEV